MTDCTIQFTRLAFQKIIRDSNLAALKSISGYSLMNLKSYCNTLQKVTKSERSLSDLHISNILLYFFPFHFPVCSPSSGTYIAT